MTLFFINYRDGATLVEDPEGSILPNLVAACHEVMASAREIVASQIMAGEIVGDQIFEITDEAGILQASLPLRDALRLS